MPGRNFLFVPGPTNVPERILRAMDRAMEDHRSSAFPELATGLLRDLRKVFKTTTGQAFIFPATGTGGWEAALVNTRSPGDRILAPRYGQFSHLWIDLAQRHGLRVDIIDVEWGEGAPADRIGEILSQDKQHEIKGVLVVHNETATGVTSDVGAVRSAIDAAQHPALLYVDGVSSIGSIDFRMEEWKVDLAITGSQKGLMLPAGLGIVCASPKALAAREQAKCPRAFFDFGDMIRANATGYFPYTPSIPMLYGLRESLAIISEEGLENIFARHQRLADGVRAAVRAWGLKLCAKAPKWYSNTVSAIMVPEGANGADVIDVAFRRYNLALGAGLARMAGKLFRIGHLGDLNELMLLGAIAGAEMAMRDVGIPVTPGIGVAAAAEHYRSTAAPLPPRAGATPSPDAPQAPGAKPSPPPHPRLQRSELAVPGSQPALFLKALESAADYVFLDLEDAVAPADKEQARQNVVAGLLEHDWKARGKTIAVRINGIDTHYMYRDVVDVVEQAGHKLDVVLVPKVGVPGDVYLVDALLTQIETARRIPHRIGIELLIETALGMANVEAIAQSSRRLEAMHFGVADFAASVRARTVSIGGLNPDYPGDQWHGALVRMVTACRAYGLRAIDGPYGDFKDPDGFRAAARRAAALGYEGKWAIHPSQIALANEVFTPPPTEVERARRILLALDEAARAGRGAAQLDGRMIDAASARMAQNIVDMAAAIAARAAGAPPSALAVIRA